MASVIGRGSTFVNMNAVRHQSPSLGGGFMGRRKPSSPSTAIKTSMPGSGIGDV
jgi:hypothetical protein